MQKAAFLILRYHLPAWRVLCLAYDVQHILDGVAACGASVILRGVAFSAVHHGTTDVFG